MKQYDIFISYKRKSLATANNLYYRLITRGYSTFFDIEETRKGDFSVQLLDYIENANDVFVILEEGSLDACIQQNMWEEDWLCKEIAHALKTKRNIIPILLDGYKMPPEDFLPEGLKGLSHMNAPEFSFSFFDEYLNKLIQKGYITSNPTINDTNTSVFKFYSDEDCQVYKDGKLVCCIKSMSDEPYYLPVYRKGEYRFKCILNTGKIIIKDNNIDNNEEKIIHIKRKKIVAKIHLFYAFSSVMLILNIAIIFYYRYININNRKSMITNTINTPTGNIESTLTEIYKTQELINRNTDRE